MELIQGDFPANGVLGLAPSNDNRSIVKTLKDQGQISRGIVALNYEDPLDTTQASSVGFGETDFAQVVGGEDGLETFSNVGFNEWALLVDHVMYGDMHTVDDDSTQTVVHTKIALLDSGNSTIQLPDSEFRAMKAAMIEAEPSLHEVEKANGEEI